MVNEIEVIVYKMEAFCHIAEALVSHPAAESAAILEEILHVVLDLDPEKRMGNLRQFAQVIAKNLPAESF